MLEFLTTDPMPALLLLLGGLLAIAIAILGDSKRTSVDNIARVLGFFVGAVLILLAIALLWDGIGTTSTWLISILLGIGLFFKIFKKVPLAVLLALLVGVIVAFLLLEADLDTVVVLIITVIVMIIVFVLTRFVEFIGDLVGKILGLRPVLFILGLLGMLEAALLFMDSSLMTMLGL